MFYLMINVRVRIRKFIVFFRVFSSCGMPSLCVCTDYFKIIRIPKYSSLTM